MHGFKNPQVMPMRSAGNLMRFVAKFAGKSPAKLENEEHDEDHEDLHPTFPDFINMSRNPKFLHQSIRQATYNKDSRLICTKTP